MIVRWAAAYCEPRRELFARDELTARGYTVFCPFERVTRRRKVAHRYRLETVDLAVFAPYLFVKTAEFKAAAEVPGVHSIVSVAGRPLTVPDRIISRLRAVSDEQGLVTKDITKPSFWFQGDIGHIFEFGVKSPLRGFTGKISSLAELDETGELKAWVEMLGGEREISVPLSAVGHIVGLPGAPRIAASVG